MITIPNDMNGKDAIKIVKKVFHFYSESDKNDITWTDLNLACAMAVEALELRGKDARK